MRSKVLLRFLTFVVIAIVIIHWYAAGLMSNIQQVVGSEDSEHSEVLYKALVLDNYANLTYLVLSLSFVSTLLFIRFFKSIKVYYRWLLGVLFGVVFLMLELMFYKNYF